MNRNEAITGLAEYALDKELIRPEEKIWAVNSLLDVLANRYLFTRRTAGK